MAGDSGIGAHPLRIGRSLDGVAGRGYERCGHRRVDSIRLLSAPDHRGDHTHRPGHRVADNPPHLGRGQDSLVLFLCFCPQCRGRLGECGIGCGGFVRNGACAVFRYVGVGVSSPRFSPDSFLPVPDSAAVCTCGERVISHGREGSAVLLGPRRPTRKSR